MISGAVAARLADEAGEFAKINGIDPVKVLLNDIKYFPPFPFPSVGDYVPDDLKPVKTFFVDSSGLGQVGECALTINQFVNAIETLTLEEGPLYWAMTEEGEFQVYVTAFREIA